MIDGQREQEEQEEQEEYRTSIIDEIPFLIILIIGSCSFGMWMNDCAAGFAVGCLLFYLKY